MESGAEDIFLFCERVIAPINDFDFDDIDTPLLKKQLNWFCTNGADNEQGRKM